MAVAVMNVGGVLVLVLDALVTMHMRVLSDERRVMDVRVVAVIVAMKVLVLERFVNVPVSVFLADMEIHAQREHPGSCDRERSRVTIAERPCEGGADERSEREHRTGATGADSTLCVQIEIEARAVAGGTTRDEHGRMIARRQWLAPRE